MDLNFDQFYQRSEFSQWRSQFEQAINQRTDPKRHGDLSSWLKILSQLPDIKSTLKNYNQPAIQIGVNSEIIEADYQQLDKKLRALIPWRKGPYNLFGVHINTEWRSDWKWNRVEPYISDLANKKVLDVGCGNGYHCWRILGSGAEYVLGIDPSMRFQVQHMAIQKYAQESNFDLLPLGIEDMPTDMPLFDSVFSMGVLYHRRNPINHLLELQQLLNDGGELILETLIVDKAKNGILQPKKRYAQMRNVWSILTIDKTIDLLKQIGFSNVRCVDQTITSTNEQRVTDWMQFHSLADFLDPTDQSKTIEGYPAPKRGIFIATKS